MWIKDKEIAGDTVTKPIISEKCCAIYADLRIEQRRGVGRAPAHQHTNTPAHQQYQSWLHEVGLKNFVSVPEFTLWFVMERHLVLMLRQLKSSAKNLQNLLSLKSMSHSKFLIVTRLASFGRKCHKGPSYEHSQRKENARPQAHEGQTDTGSMCQCQRRL